MPIIVTLTGAPGLPTGREWPLLMGVMTVITLICLPRVAKRRVPMEKRPFAARRRCGPPPSDLRVLVVIITGAALIAVCLLEVARKRTAAVVLVPAPADCKRLEHVTVTRAVQGRVLL